MTRTPSTSTPVLEDELSQLFFSGDYEGVLRRASADGEAMHQPVVIGALAMVGRIDEAQMAGAEATRQYKSAEELALYRFFMCMGYCHGGLYSEAEALAVSAIRAGRRGPPLTRFLSFQAAALVRYFQGWVERADVHAKRAHAAALASSVPYARLIALDLRGHVAVQLGQLRRGIRALRDAESLALELGFSANAQTARTSHLLYALRLASPKRAEAASKLLILATDDAVSRFAKRNALLGLALYEAVSGRAEHGGKLWNDARDLTLESDDRRGHSRVLLIGAVIATMRGERDVAAARWAELPVGDAPEWLEIERAYLRALLSLPFDTEPIEALFNKTSIERARIAVGLANSAPDTTRFDWPAVARAPAKDPIDEVVKMEALGLLPFILGRDPGQRIFIGDSSWIIESVGEISVREVPSKRVSDVLGALANGAVSKSDLLEQVWGLRGYNPALHDGTIHKTISRLRKALTTHSDWVVTTDDGYSLREGVEVILRNGRKGSVAGPVIDQPPRIRASQEDQVMDAARRLGKFSCGEFAARLSVSPATALRLLRPLVEQGLVTREGKGKNTRYQFMPSS